MGRANLGRTGEAAEIVADRGLRVRMEGLRGWCPRLGGLDRGRASQLPGAPLKSSPFGEGRAGSSEVGGDSREKWEVLVFAGLSVGEQMCSQTVAHPPFLPISDSILYLGGPPVSPVPM